MSKLRIGRHLTTGAVSVFAVWMLYLQVDHKLTLGHMAPFGLHADVIAHDVSIGIPGITKMYEPTLTNHGLLPALVEKCTFTSDTNTAGTMVAYNIERWNSQKSMWIQVMEFAKPSLCTPTPLSMGNTHWRYSWLWPGQSISSGEEATGGRAEFRNLVCNPVWCFAVENLL